YFNELGKLVWGGEGFGVANLQRFLMLFEKPFSIHWSSLLPVCNSGSLGHNGREFPGGSPVTPRSLFGRLTLLQQWAGATVLAVIPLLLAVSYAVIALQQQAAGQRQLAQDMDRLTGQTAALAENARDMVRSARQYLLLRDDSFLQLHRQKAAALAKVAEDLPRVLPGAEERARLSAIAASAVEMGDLLAAGGLTDETLSQRVGELMDHTEALVDRSDRHRREAIAQGQRDFNRSVDQLLLLTLLALPGTFLLMIIGTFAVSRPIWRLSQAIKGLGRQQWDTPIAVRGPADLVALGNSLEWMRQQVQASDRQKTAFIQHVTHELKTPLAAIIEAGNLLRDGVAGPLGEEQAGELDILRGNARNLQELIQQLLNYNAVSHGMMTHRDPVDIRQRVDAIRHDLAAADPAKVIHWRLDGTPAPIPCDARLLEMILRNLLGNAFAFSPSPGEIRVAWDLDGERWRLLVADRGPGIDPDELPHIFTPFYKGRTGRRDSAPRNGIGLAIVAEAVRLLEGRITVEATPGEGACFCCEFPYHPLEDTP